MFVWYVVASLLLAAILVGSALGKLRRADAVVQNLDRAAVPHAWYPWLATAELAGVAGLLAGLAWRPLGTAAATGLTLYFIGALAAHLKAGDRTGLGPAGFLLFLSAAAGVTSLL
ncbi:DoxX family protein [Dactylosporangium sp. NPDC049140]|uniref:DoxX family protein n=1 Tax=Dactylosporangium sp. NPDC049140 TaxID=3155647 RepID=UPI00340EE292